MFEGCWWQNPTMDESLQRAIGVAIMVVAIPLAWLLLMKVIYWGLFLAGRLWRKYAHKPGVGADTAQ